MKGPRRCHARLRDPPSSSSSSLLLFREKKKVVRQFVRLCEVGRWQRSASLCHMTDDPANWVSLPHIRVTSNTTRNVYDI